MRTHFDDGRPYPVTDLFSVLVSRLFPMEEVGTEILQHTARGGTATRHTARALAHMSTTIIDDVSEVEAAVIDLQEAQKAEIEALRAELAQLKGAAA